MTIIPNSIYREFLYLGLHFYNEIPQGHDQLAFGARVFGVILDWWMKVMVGFYRLLCRGKTLLAFIRSGLER